MTVEAYRASAFNQAAGSQFLNGGMLWYLADFISSSSSWNIIDSWAATTYQAPATENIISGRYKGDPIADVQWTVIGDIAHGAGIVIEQANPRDGYPPLQIVIQVGANSTLGYISGHTYRADWFVDNDSQFLASTFRIGTQGDWDFDDDRPDFADTAKSSDTYKHDWGHLGAGQDIRMYFAADDDWLLPTSSNEDSKDFQNCMWFGQYNPKTDGQDTVANPAYGILAYNKSLPSGISPDGDGLTAILTAAPSNNTHYFGALDENGDFQEWEYAANSGLEGFLDGSSQPNEYEPGVTVDLFEIIIRGRGTGAGFDDRLIGSLRGVYAGWRLGNGAKFDSDTYICYGAYYGLISEWDGSTAV
jgi:hypothetical protein